MLYKKYHKDFVRKFKKGVKFSKFSIYGKEIEYKVDIEPFIYNIINIFPISINVGAKVIINGDITSELPLFESLITSSGRLGIENIEFIENVI